MQLQRRYKTEWDQKALEGKRQVAAYIYKKFGINSKKKFLQRVRDMEKTLKINPYFVNKDPLFEGYTKEMRSVFINNLSRMVYYVEGDIIHIAAFWDGRRDAENQAAQIQEKL